MLISTLIRRQALAVADTPEIAPMLAGDVPLVDQIEQRNYEFPWTAGIFRDCLKAGYTCRVLRLDDDIVGYGILQVAVGEAHLLNLCVDADRQHRGFARLLLEHLIALSVSQGAQMMFLEVRPSNPRAVRLYEQAGFNEIGTRPGYYKANPASHAHGREDAVVMALSLALAGSV